MKKKQKKHRGLLFTCITVRIHLIHLSLATNYRPISILPTLSKILERVIPSQLHKYLNSTNLLSNNQFGFCSKRSTATALSIFDSANKFIQGLCWPQTQSDHAEYVISKVNQRLGLLRRVKHLLPFTARLLFYNSLVLPIFDYGDLVWGDIRTRLL